MDTNSSDDLAVTVDDVSKIFRLPHEKTASIKSLLINFRKRRTYENLNALKKVSFDIKKGEFFGIVGRNGSGKSTLLKLLAGIYAPTTGTIKINGSLTPFIELGVGFNTELTGRENVFLNGALLGFNRKEMQKMYADIVDFAELDRFMDQKLKNYSSGMQVRLAFSIAIRAKTDILLIDEVLAVGDAAFQRKCLKYFEQLKKESKTVVFVTHDMSSFEKYCDRGILIDSGRLIYKGEPFLLSAEYKMINSPENKITLEPDTKLDFDNSINSVNLNGKDKVILKSNDTVDVAITIMPKKDIKAIAGISIVRDDGVYIAFHNTKKALGPLTLIKGKKYKINYQLEASQFMPGIYRLDVALYDSNNNYIDLKAAAGKIAIVGKENSKYGILNLNGIWSVNDKN